MLAKHWTGRRILLQEKLYETVVVAAAADCWASLDAFGGANEHDDSTCLDSWW